MILGPNVHGKEFDFYLKRYVKILHGYKESQFTCIFKNNSRDHVEIWIGEGGQGVGGSSQVESRRPFRSMEDFPGEAIHVASFSVAMTKTVVKITCTDLR